MLIPMLFVACLALATGMIMLHAKLAEIGSGKDVVRISRRSRLPPEAAWANLQSAWGKNALTFQPATFLPTREQGTRMLISTIKGRTTERILKTMPMAGGMTLGYRLYREEDVDYPFGEGHFERWSIVPALKGSRIEVTTQGLWAPLAAGMTLLNVWRKAGLVASGKLDRTISTFQSRSMPSRLNTRPSRKPAATLPRFGREAIVSLAAFAVLLIQFSWQSAIVLAALILFHEYGHLLSYQLTGRKGNRLMLVPFFGGIAVAGAPHKSEFERAFCALAGPGICTATTIAALAICYFSANADILFWSWDVVYFSAILNLLNLLPIYPLDGGHAMESFFRTYLPSRVRPALIATSVAGLLLVLGMGYTQTALFFGVFAYGSLNALPQRSRLRTMTAGETVQITLAYAVITAVHLFGYYAYFHPLTRL